MDNGALNAADKIMHPEVARIWCDIDADPTDAGGDFDMTKEIIGNFQTRHGSYGKSATSYNLIN